MTDQILDIQPKEDKILEILTKKKGRKKKVHNVRAALTSNAANVSNPLVAKSSRPQRTPLAKQRVIDIPARAGYVQRIVSEKAGRIDAFQAAGWSIRHGDINEMRDNRAQNSSQMGSAVRFTINPNATTTAQTGVLMEIPEELYREDQMAKSAALKETEKLLDPHYIKQKNKAYYGEMKIEQRSEN